MNRSGHLRVGARRDSKMKMKNTIISLGAILMFCLAFNSILFAEVYQWTDADGSEHFSDTPPASNRKTKKLKIIKTSEPISASVPLQNDIKPERKEQNIIVENQKNDPATEREIKSTWQAFRDAVARGNAQEAASQFASRTRSNQLEVFKELGNKLPGLAKEMNDIEISHVYDNNSAVAKMYRNEMVGRQMKKK
jgi:hypothetical protein